MILFLDMTIFEFLANNCKRICSCFARAKEAVEDAHLVSDDYYDLLDLKFIISEYRRAKVELLSY